MLQETGILGVPRQPDVVLTGEQQRRLRIILLGVLLETRPRAQPANAEHPGAGTMPSPGRLRRISALGCCSKDRSSSASPDDLQRPPVARPCHLRSWTRRAGSLDPAR